MSGCGPVAQEYGSLPPAGEDEDEDDMRRYSRPAPYARWIKLKLKMLCKLKKAQRPPPPPSASIGHRQRRPVRRVPAADSDVAMSGRGAGCDGSPTFAHTSEAPVGSDRVRHHD